MLTLRIDAVLFAMADRRRTALGDARLINSCPQGMYNGPLRQKQKLAPGLRAGLQPDPGGGKEP
jgi:hypothetical protein